MIDQPGWFGPADRALFGWLCTPGDGTASLGVLLCPPVGEEEHNAHETFRELAHALAREGVASLRLDYHGTGDSLGRWDDPGRVEAWTTSVADGLEALRAAGVARVALAGMRVGAALAVAAARRDGLDLRALVLWDPCSGRSMLREGQARRPGSGPVPEGAADTPGYLYAAEAVADMQALDPAAGDPADPGAPVADVLVLVREDRPAPRGLRSRYRGAHVTWRSCSGQADLLDVPVTENTVPREALDDVVAWLVERAGPSVPVRPVLRAELPAGAPGRADGLTERVVTLGGARLFGILSEPAEPTRAPLVVLVNVANDRHVGPGRRWVDASRAWGALGFRVLRLDQSGTGDSPCGEGQRFGVLYAREWLADLPDALASAPRAGQPLAVVGVCSGAYSAMEAAFHAPVDVVYAVNVILHARVTSRWSELADERRAAARPPTLPFLRLGDHRPRLAALLWRAYRQVTVWNAPMAAVHALCRRGTNVVLVMSRNDGLHFRESAFWSLRYSRRRAPGSGYALHESDAVDHPLMTQEGQQWVVERITDDLTRRFPVVAAPPTPVDGAPNPVPDPPALVLPTTH